MDFLNPQLITYYVIAGLALWTLILIGFYLYVTYCRRNNQGKRSWITEQMRQEQEEAYKKAFK